MSLKSTLISIFGAKKSVITSGNWREIGTYQSIFTAFDGNIYQNDLIRACVRTLAENTSKANVKCIRKTENGKIKGDNHLERLIQYRPNMYMNGKDFLYKVRTLLELNNTAFIYINRDERGKCISLYPVPSANSEALDVNGRLYLKFYFKSGATLIASWEDLAILRKDYNTSDIFGDSNRAILGSIDLLNTINQGQANAIRSTANLRGILKSTKSMLKENDTKIAKENFVREYMNLENEGGIASLDTSQEFIPIKMEPNVANFKQAEELRNNIYRYFGVNEDILTSQAFGDKWEAFYESRLEPFLIALGLELTNKIFTERERGFGNEIIFEASRLAYASTSTKLTMVNLIDRGVITLNEYREILNLSPVEGGDVRIIRKEYAEAQNLNIIQGVEEINDTKTDEEQ